ncbi:MAG: flagellar hook-length control protein FliK [Bacillota bacterium]|nr:flagellar hook-length control protein FliK [Bacillota bacterium]
MGCEGAPDAARGLFGLLTVGRALGEGTGTPKAQSTEGSNLFADLLAAACAALGGPGLTETGAADAPAPAEGEGTVKPAGDETAAAPAAGGERLEPTVAGGAATDQEGPAPGAGAPSAAEGSADGPTAAVSTRSEAWLSPAAAGDPANVTARVEESVAEPAVPRPVTAAPEKQQASHTGQAEQCLQICPVERFLEEGAGARVADGQPLQTAGQSEKAPTQGGPDEQGQASGALPGEGARLVESRSGTVWVAGVKTAPPSPERFTPPAEGSSGMPGETAREKGEPRPAESGASPADDGADRRLSAPPSESRAAAANPGKPAGVDAHRPPEGDQRTERVPVSTAPEGSRTASEEQRPAKPTVAVEHPGQGRPAKVEGGATREAAGVEARPASAGTRAAPPQEEPASADRPGMRPKQTAGPAIADWNEQGWRTEKSASPGSAKAEPLRPYSRAELRDLPQFVRRAELVARSGAPTEMRVQLVPESLGRLSVRVSVAEGGVTARLVVENPEVKALVEERLPELERALRDQGFRLAGLSVGCEDAGAGQGGFLREEVREPLGWGLSRSAARHQYEETPAVPVEPAIPASHLWAGSGGLLDALM